MLPRQFLCGLTLIGSGYLVTEKAYAEGGYEVGATRVKSGAETAIVDNLLNMINAL